VARHLVGHSLNFCSWKDRKTVAAKLREVYSAETAEAAWDALEAFDADWNRRSGPPSNLWRSGPSPVDRAGLAPGPGGGGPVLRLQPRDPPRDPYHECHLAIRGHERTSRTVRGWLTAVNQFAIMFEDRFKPIGG